MAGAENVPQRLLKAKRGRHTVRKVHPPAPVHLPSPQLPSSIPAPSSWAPNITNQRLPHAPSASNHHHMYVATALELPNLLEASRLEDQLDSHPSDLTEDTSSPTLSRPVRPPTTQAGVHHPQAETPTISAQHVVESDLQQMANPSTSHPHSPSTSHLPSSFPSQSHSSATRYPNSSLSSHPQSPSISHPHLASIPHPHSASTSYRPSSYTSHPPSTSGPYPLASSTILHPQWPGESGTSERDVSMPNVSGRWPASHAESLLSHLAYELPQGELSQQDVEFSSPADMDISLFGKPRTSAGSFYTTPQSAGPGRRSSTPSPGDVAALSRAFHLSEEKAQALATTRPTLLSFTEEQIARRAQELCELLQIRASQALLAIRKQPFLLQTDLDTLRGRLAGLQQQLGLDMQLTCRLCANAPSVLKRPADKLGERFERLAQSLAMTKAEVVDMSGRCSHTQFLTERSRKLQARFEALKETLHLDTIQTAKVVKRQPDILFMSSRILANKVKVLQAVFGTKHRKVTPLVAKCPEVLRRDMNSIRRIVCMLQVMLNVAPEFVYKMMAHNARLLSMNFQSTQWKAAQLREAANSCSCWASQWQDMVPKHVEHCLSATQTTYYRLHYIMQTGQQEKMKLLDALRTPLFKFQQEFPDYSAWLQQQQLRQQLQQ